MKIFISITELWRILVYLGTSTNISESFDSIKALINAKCLKATEGEILLHIEDVGYGLVVEEVNSNIQIIQKAHTTIKLASMGAFDSNEGMVGD